MSKSFNVSSLAAVLRMIREAIANKDNAKLRAIFLAMSPTAMISTAELLTPDERLVLRAAMLNQPR